jgi:excinuclease ABC subunit C
MNLDDNLDDLPPAPGVYLFKDTAGKVIYVGKAKSLRKRVRSYAVRRDQTPAKVQAMLARAAGLDTIVTATEKEALILEGNLIKKHRPRYNVILRDDKNYLALRIDPREEYPRLGLVRQIKKDGAHYFGPFASAHAVRETLKVINRVFPLRQCSGSTFRKRQRPCLNFQMGRCLGLCARTISPEDYGRVVEEAVLFLKGRTTDLQERLREEMARAAAALEFERAAMYRDRLAAIEKTLERQRVVSTRFRDQDVIGVYADEEGLALAVLFIRGGRLVGSRVFEVKSPREEEPNAVRAFVQQYYGEGAPIPEEVLVGSGLEEQELLAEWLGDLKGQRVTIRAPQRGDGRHLVAMAAHNAATHLFRRRSQAGDAEGALRRLQELLGLAAPPRRLECVDISNIQGRFAVGSLVAFQDGHAEKSGYRRYRIKMVEEPNDPAMMAEVLRRRFTDPKDSQVLPDLLVVDGGKGQLARTLAVLGELGLNDRVPVVALAKGPREDAGDEARPGERLYLPGRKNPFMLRGETALAALLARLRDEAHRFAITYYQKRHRQRILQSRLDEVSGVGPARRQALIRHFGSVREVAAATPEDISRVPGISRGLAERIHAELGVRKVGSVEDTP